MIIEPIRGRSRRIMIIKKTKIKQFLKASTTSGLLSRSCLSRDKTRRYSIPMVFKTSCAMFHFTPLYPISYYLSQNHYE